MAAAGPTYVGAPDAIEIKFIGRIESYNEAKKFGMVSCVQAQQMWGQEIYIYKDVMASADAGIGDTIRFGIHVNQRGQPQASLPVFKIGEDGLPIGLPPGANWINAEEAVAEDPSFLENIKQEIEDQSMRRHRKRGRIDSTGPAPRAGKAGEWPPQWGTDGGWGKGASWDGWGGPDAWGKGGGGPAAAGCWGPQEGVDIFVSGVPTGASRRELLHIFRQYAGFTSLRQVSREDHMLVFVTFATPAQAQFVAEALNGYIFDEEAPPGGQSVLQLAPARQKPPPMQSLV